MFLSVGILVTGTLMEVSGMEKRKRAWRRPQIEEVTLEAEEDVLATCSTTSQTTRKGGACKVGDCATYP